MHSCPFVSNGINSDSDNLSQLVMLATQFNHEPFSVPDNTQFFVSMIAPRRMIYHANAIQDD